MESFLSRNGSMSSCARRVKSFEDSHNKSSGKKLGKTLIRLLSNVWLPDEPFLHLISLKVEQRCASKLKDLMEEALVNVEVNFLKILFTTTPHVTFPISPTSSFPVKAFSRIRFTSRLRSSSPRLVSWLVSFAISLSKKVSSPTLSSPFSYNWKALWSSIGWSS